MNRPAVLVAAAAACALLTGAWMRPAAELELAPPPADPTPLEGNSVTLGLVIARGSTLGGMLSPFELSASELRAAALSVYDLANLRAGRELQLVYRGGEHGVVEVRYAVDADSTLVLQRSDDGWTAELDEVAYASELGTRLVTIDHSLWADGLAAGLRPEDLARLATIFEYELDFNSELQAGATLSIAADIERSATRTRLGVVHAVRLTNKGKTYTAVLAGEGDKASFYHPDGSGVARPFLRSPLAFSARVTSSFNPNRFHPVLKTRRPHNGTDFGAPTGTPVRTVASGAVVYAGVSGGHGNYVKVKHDNGYETSYSHLSKISVRTGQRLNQGQVIGKVGSTGLSTGPHLHWQMWRNGQIVDAMRTKMPTSSPLPPSAKAAFDASIARWLPMLDSAEGVADAR